MAKYPNLKTQLVNNFQMLLAAWLTEQLPKLDFDPDEADQLMDDPEAEAAIGEVVFDASIVAAMYLVHQRGVKPSHVRNLLRAHVDTCERFLKSLDEATTVIISRGGSA